MPVSGVSKSALLKQKNNYRTENQQNTWEKEKDQNELTKEKVLTTHISPLDPPMADEHNGDSSRSPSDTHAGLQASGRNAHWPWARRDAVKTVPAWFEAPSLYWTYQGWYAPVPW